MLILCRLLGCMCFWNLTAGYFCEDGIILDEITDGSSGEAVSLQDDGKIVVAGFNAVDGVNRFALARYNVDGSLDLTFNGTGMVTTVIGTCSAANGIAIQDDGKIVVAGSAVDGVDRFALARYNVDGSLDLTFNGTGMVTTVIGTSSSANGMAIQDDGKVVVVGESVGGVGTQAAFARYNSVGSLDTSFNGTGIVILPAIGNGGQDEALFFVAVQDDRKIVATGIASTDLSSKAATIRLLPNGMLDVTCIIVHAGENYTIVEGSVIDLDLIVEPGGTIIIDQSVTTPLQVNGVVVLAGTLQITGVSSGGTLAVISANEIIGTFDNVEVDGCSSANDEYSMTTVSVVISFQQCNGGLSKGAIIGIAVGGVVVALIIVLLIVAVSRRRIAATTVAQNQIIKDKNVNDMQVELDRMKKVFV